MGTTSPVYLLSHESIWSYDVICWIFPIKHVITLVVGGHIQVIWVSTQKQGYFFPQMDGENNGQPAINIHDFGGVYPYFWKHPYFDIKNNQM